ncbi:hypothetical protein [Cryobacterium sp. Y62]|uniref:hypothetical protein n=1 Tax=Cryobacterium sp. Y62 TaxID=2048284 RepID=UPI000CE2E42A|nr:hypothetical protein [Cryobacterium sp. Y62]
MATKDDRRTADEQQRLLNAAFAIREGLDDIGDDARSTDWQVRFVVAYVRWSTTAELELLADDKVDRISSGARRTLRRRRN